MEDKAEKELENVSKGLKGNIFSPKVEANTMNEETLNADFTKMTVADMITYLGEVMH